MFYEIKILGDDVRQDPFREYKEKHERFSI